MHETAPPKEDDLPLDFGDAGDLFFDGEGIRLKSVGLLGTGEKDIQELVAGAFKGGLLFSGLFRGVSAADELNEGVLLVDIH